MYQLESPRPVDRLVTYGEVGAGPVAHVSDQPPTTLTDFIGHRSFALNTRTADVLRIVGQGAASERSVNFYEKSADGLGKDIRV